eukprot:jgi/Astpho2/3437/Aster-07037
MIPEDQKRLEESREQHWRAVQDGRQQRKQAKAATRQRKQAKPCKVQAPAAAAPAHAARGGRVTSRHRTDTSVEETPAAMLQQSLDAEAEGDDLDAVASKGLTGNISRSKQASLLSAKDEVALAKQISKIKPYLLKRDEMTEEQGQQPTLSEWATACGFEDEEAFQSRVAIGEEARQTMIWANQRLVISMARKFTGRGMDMPDLIAEGMTGLAKGVDRFDHTKGFKFSTYAHWWIRQAISRSLSEQGRMIRLPVHVYEQMLKINKARKQFIDDNDRMPTNEELSKASGIGMDRLELVVKAHNDPMHLDAPSAFGGDDGDGSTIGDYIRDPAPSPFQMLLNKSLEKDLDNLLLTLTPREAAVVRMRYGMDDGKEKTLEDVGQALGVSQPAGEVVQGMG